MYKDLNNLDKLLSSRIISTGGRNFTGRTTVFHLGGGTKKKFRHINPSTASGRFFVDDIVYDPNRTSYVLSTRSFLDSGTVLGSYKLATSNVLPGSFVDFGDTVSLKNGNRTRLSRIPTGFWVHSLELRPNEGPTVARSAGTSVRILRNDGYSSKILVKFPSGKTRYVDKNCYATIGSVSNGDHGNKILGKAGVSRWLGRRPTVRGIAMNPVDHPHGGRTNGGKQPRTPWGKLTRGVKTRSSKRH